MDKIRRLVYENNLSALREYLKFNDINYLDNKNNSLLHYAIIYKKLEIAYFLIQEHIFVNQTNSLGETPLYLAVHFNLLSLVDTLLKNNANPSLVNNNNETAFFHACRLGRTEIISLFMEYFNYDLREANSQGETPLFALVRNNDFSLFKKYYKPDLLNTLASDQKSLLHVAAMYPNLALISFLIEEGLNPNLRDRFNNTCLYYAINAKNKEAIKLLLEKGALTTIINKEGLILSDLLRDFNKELLEYDRSQEIKRNYPLSYAIILNDERLFKESLSLDNLFKRDIYNKLPKDLAKIFNNRKFYKEIKAKESQTISLRHKKW